MKKLLFILLLASLSIQSVNAQAWFLGKSEKLIRDSLSKIKYNRFDGLVFPDKHYEITFTFDDYRVYMDSLAKVGAIDKSDTLFTKLNPGVVMYSDTIHLNTYSFSFKNDSCLSFKLYYYGFKKCQNVINDLNSCYKNKVKDKEWVDSSGQIEVTLVKERISNAFWVNFKNTKK